MAICILPTVAFIDCAQPHAMQCVLRYFWAHLHFVRARARVCVCGEGWVFLRYYSYLWRPSNIQLCGAQYTFYSAKIKHCAPIAESARVRGRESERERPGVKEKEGMIERVRPGVREKEGMREREWDWVEEGKKAWERERNREFLMHIWRILKAKGPRLVSLQLSSKKALVH